MTDRDQVGGHGTLQLALRIECHVDRPGIHRVWADDRLLFDSENETITHLGLRTQVGFHSHFEPPTFALLWREPA